MKATSRCFSPCVPPSIPLCLKIINKIFSKKCQEDQVLVKKILRTTECVYIFSSASSKKKEELALLCMLLKINADRTIIQLDFFMNGNDVLTENSDPNMDKKELEAESKRLI